MATFSNGEEETYEKMVLERSEMKMDLIDGHNYPAMVLQIVSESGMNTKVFNAVLLDHY